MTPLLTGVFASQISGHLNTFSPTGSYDALASYTVPSGGVTTIEFAGLPATGYKHLQLRMNHQQSNGGVSVNIAFNDDTNVGNYARHVIYGAGGSVYAFGEAGSGGARSLLYINTAGTVPSSTVWDLLDYNNPSKFKTTRMLSGKWYSTSDQSVSLEGKLWRNTSPINKITLTVESGTITQNSKFSLYGIRG
jgi:hypothetical protein